MNADQGSDPGRQRTVAELLQQYGGEGRNGGARRRRRAAEPEDAPETRAEGEPPAYPSTSEERPEPAARLGDPGGTSALDSTWGSLGSPSGRTLNPDTGGFDARNGSGSYTHSSFGASSLEASPLDARGGGGAPGLSWDRPHAASNAPSADLFTSSGPVRRPGEATEHFPRYRGGAAEAGRGAETPEAPVDAPRNRVIEDSGPSTAVASRAALFDDEQDDERDPAVGPDGDAKRDTGAPAGLDDGTDIDVEPSAVKAWAVLIAQGVLGAVGGAALWVGFSYLWRNFPVVALVAAVVATGGLVLTVRMIRGSDDLRTTMLAILVGLVVTISPVALMIATSAR